MERLQQITEMTSDRMDSESKTLHNVCILSNKSNNGHTYTRQALLDVVKLFEGAKVQEGHSYGKPVRLRDFAGRITGLYEKDSKVYAKNFQVINEGFWPTLSGISSKDPSACGISIEAEGNIKNKMVERVYKGGVVCLVTNPATTTSLYEQENTMDYTLITEETLKTERPDLVKSLVATLESQVKELTNLVEQLAPKPIGKMLSKLSASEGKELIEAFNSKKPVSYAKTDGTNVNIKEAIKLAWN